MKKITLLAVLAATSFTVQAQVVITPQGNYVVTQSQSTTYVTGPSTNNSTPVAVVAPVAVNPITGVGQVITPQGSYTVQRSGNTTVVIPTSKSR